MKSLTDSPALLTVHSGAPGQYILRVSDVRHRSLLVGVTKLLGDATSLVVITPSDIKVFTNGNQAKEEIVAAEVESEEGTVIPEEVDPMGTDSPPQPEVDEPEPDPTPPARARRRPKSAPVAGHDETCGRCKGAGRIKMLLDGGAPADSPCPICQGSGVMRRYGARR